MRPIVFVLVLLFAVPAAAQVEIARATVTTSAPIFIQPGARTPLRVAKAGTTLRVLQEDGEWIEVEFQDPQYGRRVGWVERKLVQIHRPELEPMDLSVREAAAPTPPLRDAPPTAVDPPASAYEQPAIRPIEPRRARGWLDINLGSASAAERSFDTETIIADLDGETHTYRVGYRFPTGASFDIGGGYMFTPFIGIGAQLTGTAHQDSANLYIRIPHPRYYDAYATDSSFTDDDLTRAEGALNLSLVAAVPGNNPDLNVRLYGGPTYFRLEADAVYDIRYLQQYGLFTTANSVDITEWFSEKVEQTGWGFHAGVDVGYFFSRVVGIGGFARVTRGSVTFGPDEFLVANDIDVKVGGFQAGGGLRLRF